MEKVRIGIIGMGRMGMTHYPIINTHPSVEIVSVADTSSVILDMMKKYIPNLKTYTDYRDLLNARDVDGVIICTPSAFHYDACKLAGGNGIAVFCEKPFTTSPEKARELAELFEKKALVNQVGYVYRYSPVFNNVKKCLEDGLIGKLVQVKSEFFSSTIIKPQSGKGWRSLRENGGGATYEMGAHILDLLTYILGKPEKVFGSVLNNVFSEGVEDIMSTNLLFKNNVSCSVLVDWSDVTYRKPMIKLEFLGDKGKIMADSYGLKVYLVNASEKYGFIEGWNSVPMNMMEDHVPFYVRGNGFTHQLYDFADEILGKKSGSKCSFREAAGTQEVIHTIFNNSKSL
jgi:predicted dehydrogenase